MSSFTTRAATLAAVVFVALPIATVGTQARAQASVQLSGLDLSTASGQAIFNHRANRAADQVCGDKNPSIANPCKAAVVAELNEKLAGLTPATQFAATSGSRASVRIADLNLASSAGKSDFDHRVSVAADRVCRDERNLTIQAGCRLAVRAEATEKLAMITSGVQYAAR